MLDRKNDKEMEEILQEYMRIEKWACGIKSCEEVLKLGGNFQKILEVEGLRIMLIEK